MSDPFGSNGNTGNTSLFDPIGSSALIEYGGFIAEEWLPELAGVNFNRAIAEMVESDPIVGGAMFAIETMLSRADWWLDPAAETPEAHAINDFVSDALLRDMDPSWEDIFPAILSFLPYGWALLETVYKRRQGPKQDPAESSLFDDGLIGWQTWGVRPQESRYRWEFDKYGRPLAMVQTAPPDYKQVYIPLERCLLLRTSSRKNNPEGFPLLRRAFRPYMYRRRLEKLEGIGAERDLAGIPKGTVPEAITRAGATAEQKASYESFKRTLNNLKQNTQASILIPQAYDQVTKQPLYQVELLQAGGARQFNTNDLIQRYGQDIVMSLMAGFLWLGRGTGRGSYALAQSMTAMFNQAMQAWLDKVAAAVTDQAIRRLCALNGFPPELTPELKHSKVEQVDLQMMSLYITALAGAGFDLTGDPAIFRQLLVAADLPVPAETEEETEQTNANPPGPDGAENQDVEGDDGAAAPEPAGATGGNA